MAKNESLLIAASYFWSDALNAFLFGHGPMTPTLADVYMLTGLDIDSPDNTFNTSKPSFNLKAKESKGWGDYVACHMKKGTVQQREHVVFLNMWLDKFIFCGRTVGPTSNYQRMAKLIDSGTKFPLGKHLLGAVYDLLHRVAMNLLLGQPVKNTGGPWWFINLWLNLHLRNILEEDIYKSKFPKFQPDGEVTEYRPSRKFGEAVAVFPGDKKNPGMVVNFFRSFYYGLTASATIWFAYDDPETNFESIFQFEDVTVSKLMIENQLMFY
jgi:hypothetical protein